MILTELSSKNLKFTRVESWVCEIMNVEFRWTENLSRKQQKTREDLYTSMSWQT